MPTHVVVHKGQILNIIEWDGRSDVWAPIGAEVHAYQGPAGVGWAWDGNKAIDPRPPTPDAPVIPVIAPTTGGPPPRV